MDDSLKGRLQQGRADDVYENEGFSNDFKDNTHNVSVQSHQNGVVTIGEKGHGVPNVSYNGSRQDVNIKKSGS